VALPPRALPLSPFVATALVYRTIWYKNRTVAEKWFLGTRLGFPNRLETLSGKNKAFSLLWKQFYF
jgi:hypothetical protein